MSKNWFHSWDADRHSGHSMFLWQIASENFKAKPMQKLNDIDLFEVNLRMKRVSDSRTSQSHVRRMLTFKNTVNKQSPCQKHSPDSFLSLILVDTEKWLWNLLRENSELRASNSVSEHRNELLQNLQNKKLWNS
jgi:hypothetical protein